MAWQPEPSAPEDASSRPAAGPLEASAPEYVPEQNPEHTTVAVRDYNWEEPGEMDPSGQTRRKARYLPPSRRGPNYSPPAFGQAGPGSHVAYPQVYGATADVTVDKQPSKEEVAFEEGSDIPPEAASGQTYMGKAWALAPPANTNVKAYAAPAFNDRDSVDVPRAAPTEAQLDHRHTPRPFRPFKRQVSVHYYGCFLFLTWVAAFGFYMYVRITKTISQLGGGYVAYGVALLVVEIMGATTVVNYGMNLLYNPMHEKFQEDPDSPGKPVVRLPYHVRVMVPCYKEELEIIRRTLMAAYDATLPEGCNRTIYLCDDGKDPRKRKWIASMGPEFVYVSGRKRPQGEMNGKSGNLNNCASQIYPPGTDVPLNELMCIFDADQVAKRDFFLRTLPFFDGGDDVGMVLSPQCFHNLNLHEDIFNHSNIHFWEYMQPGYDALGFISCTGTNFLVRAKAFVDVGMSPQYTMTEDFALGMELKKKKWHCRYVQAYLAVGEAPDQIRNCFQQRSRWTKGHFQIMFNAKVCPLFQRELSIPMRMMYCSGVWSYVVAAISTPFLMLVPVITIWIGVFPVIINRWAALGLTIYAAATQALLYYVRTPRHIEALYFANVANSLLWWSYVKACWRSFISKITRKNITFKATAKGGSKLKNSPMRDIWLAIVAFILLTVSIAVAIWQLVDGALIFSPLLISVLWAAYAVVPPFLLLFYATIGPGYLLQFFCRLTMIITFASGAAAVGLMWAIHESDVATAKEFSGGAYTSEQIGVLFRAIKKGFTGSTFEKTI